MYNFFTTYFIFSGSIVYVFYENHSFFNASRAEIRFRGFFSSILLINNLTFSGIYYHISLLKLSYWLLILSIVYLLELLLKGFLPDNKISKIIPQLQMSHFSEYKPSKTSGAMYVKVPTSLLSLLLWVYFNSRASPKSIILISTSSFVELMLIFLMKTIF